MAKQKKSDSMSDAFVAFGIWYGNWNQPTPFKAMFDAATFVCNLLFPDRDVLDFLLPAQKVKMSRNRKRRIELTAKPTYINTAQWQKVRDTVEKLIEQNRKHYKKIKQSEKLGCYRKIKEETNRCQSIYAYMAFFQDLRTTNMRSLLHKQIVHDTCYWHTCRNRRTRQ